MGMTLHSLVNKAKKGEQLGRRGGLAQDLIERITNYYNLALRSYRDAKDMRKAVVTIVWWKWQM